jgi:hypothetical protein
MSGAPRRLRHVLRVLAAAACVLSAAAAGQTYPPSACELELSTTLVDPGEEIVVAACGFAGGAAVTLSLRRGPAVAGLDTVRARANGDLRAELRIPADTRPGRWLLVARGESARGGALELRAVLRVAAVPPPIDVPPPVDEPERQPGFPLAIALAAVAAALVATGVVFAWLATRRQPVP